jgi:phosphoglycolate phosphatase
VEAYLKSLAQKRSRLVDSRIPGVQEPLLLAFGLEGNQLNPAGLLAVASRRENEIAAAAYVAETGRDWLEALETAEAAFAEADEYLKRKADHTPLFRGTLEILNRLTRAGIKVGLLSSDTPDHVSDFIQKYELTDHIQAYLGVKGMPSKPDPALFHQICADLEVSPSQTLMVGDALADIKMARAANAAGCIGVTWGWQAPVVDALKADITIDHWSHLQIMDEP